MPCQSYFPLITKILLMLVPLQKLVYFCSDLSRSWSPLSQQVPFFAEVGSNNSAEVSPAEGIPLFDFLHLQVDNVI